MELFIKAKEMSPEEFERWALREWGQRTWDAVLDQTPYPTLKDLYLGVKSGDFRQIGESLPALILLGTLKAGSGSKVSAGKDLVKQGSQNTRKAGVSVRQISAPRGKIVLGHYPEYIRKAEQLEARRFDIPKHVWENMTDEQRWAANKKFLDRAIARGDDIFLATPVDKVRPGSYFERELEYLYSKGYRLSPDGSRLIR